MTQVIPVALGERSYDIHIEAELLASRIERGSSRG